MRFSASPSGPSPARTRGGRIAGSRSRIASSNTAAPFFSTKRPANKNRPPLRLDILDRSPQDRVRRHNDARAVIRREAAGQEAVADMFRHADEQRRLALQGGEAPLEHGRRHAPAVMRILRRVAAMERDHQRNPQRARNRQSERAAPAEMRVHQVAAAMPRDRAVAGSTPKCLNSAPVEAAANASSAEQQRLDPEIGEPVAAMTPDPYRRQKLEPDIEPAQELRPRTAARCDPDKPGSSCRSGPARSGPSSANQRLVAGGDLVPAQPALARQRLLVQAPPQLVIAQQADRRLDERRRHRPRRPRSRRR